MKSEKEIRERIHRLRLLRAGSIFTESWEAGELFMLLWVLGEEPQLRNYEEAFCWGREMVNSPDYTKKFEETLENVS